MFSSVDLLVNCECPLVVLFRALQVAESLQDIPEGRVTFRAHGYRITVLETEGRRIRRLRFEKIPPT